MLSSRISLNIFDTFLNNVSYQIAIDINICLAQKYWKSHTKDVKQKLLKHLYVNLSLYITFARLNKSIMVQIKIVFDWIYATIEKNGGTEKVCFFLFAHWIKSWTLSNLFLTLNITTCIYCTACFGLLFLFYITTFPPRIINSHNAKT